MVPSGRKVEKAAKDDCEVSGWGPWMGSDALSARASQEAGMDKEAS